MPLDLAPDSKRQADGHGNAPPVKRLKTGEKDEDDKSGAGGVPVKREDKEIIVKQLSELPTPLTWEAALPLPKTKGQCSLVVTLGSRVWLVNRTENQVVLNKHFIIAGFYKGKVVAEGWVPGQGEELRPGGEGEAPDTARRCDSVPRHQGPPNCR